VSNVIQLRPSKPVDRIAKVKASVERISELLKQLEQLAIKENDMATPLYCPNCGENLGKDRENEKRAYCDVCGQDNIKNPRGYNPDD